MTASPARRRFNSGERAALYLASDGRCERCGTELQPGWHGDHVEPYSADGPTDVINGQALCPSCSLQKGARTVTLEPRPWQRQALDTFTAAGRKDFLVSATPGAGKTKFSLYLAQQLLRQGVVSRVAVVVPSDNLREQWAAEAAEQGIDLCPVQDAGDYDKAGFIGCVATYQQLAMGSGSDMMRRSLRRPTLVILDEIHHAGDNKSWGEALRHAVDPAVHRLCLTGTPWRRDSTSPIPFVRYDANGTVAVDYAYEYGTAVADGVCRRIEFHAYDGEARWTDPSRARRSAGDGENGKDGVQIEFAAKLGANMADDDVSAALGTVYEPKYQWMPSILRQADEMLSELREEIPDAAGLVVAERQWHAQGYAALLEKLTGIRPPVIVSDPKTDPGSKLARAEIERFKKGSGRWIVAVKMISEGVDIPRLTVGVYASKTQTRLFFRQVVGRFVRTRTGEEINARLLIPAVPELLRHAREIEDELRHQLDIAEKEADNAEDRESSSGQGELDFRTPLSASESVFDRAIMSGDEVAPEELAAAQEQCGRLGIPKMFASNLVPLLRAQAAGAAASGPEQAQATRSAQVPRYRLEKQLRQEIEMLTRRVDYRRSMPKGTTNTDLLRAGHPKRKAASVEELREIRATLLKWVAEL